MNNDLKRVGLVFEADGSTNFVKSLQLVNSSLRENYSNFQLTQAQWNQSTTTTQKLKDKLEYLNNAYDIQSDKVSTLRLQLNELENAETRDEAAIQKKRTALINAETSLQKYKNQVEETESKLKSTTLKLEKLTETLEKNGQKLTSVGNKISIFSGAYVAALGFATSKAIEFEDAFTGVEKTVNGTAEQMAELKQGIRDMSKEIPASTTEISAVAEAAGQLGIQTDNILSFTKTMINMGNATNLTADEAATTLARFANVTKMSQTDFDKLGSTIVALGNNFATTEAEIAAMGMNLGSASSQIGMSQAETMALATALSSVGLEAQAGGTAFSKLMINMQLAVETGNKDLKKFADVAGMSATEFKKAFKEDASSALLAFIDGLSKSGERGKSAIKVLDDMGITETRLRDSILRSANASDIFSNALKIGTSAWEENNALTNEADKRYSTLKSKLEIVKNKLLDNVVTIGNKLMPTVEKIVGMIGKWTDKISNLNDSQIETIIKVGAFVAASGPLLSILGKVTSTTSTLIKGVGAFSDALKVANGAMSSTSTAVNGMANVISGITSPVGLAITSFGLLAGSFALISSYSDEASKTTKKNFNDMGESANGFIKGIQSATSHLSEFNDNLFITSEEQTNIKTSMEEAQNGITEIVNRASQERRGYTDSEIQKLDEYFQKIREMSQRELEIQQIKSQAIIQMYTTELENYQGSLESYESLSQEKLKTIEDQRNVELQLIEETTTEQLALLNQRYGTQATMQNEEYAREYNKIIEQKNKNIAQANEQVAKLNEIVTNGYASRITIDEEFYNKLIEANQNVETEHNLHAQKLAEIEANKNLTLDEKLLENYRENSRHEKQLKDIWNELYKNMDENSSKQLGVYLAMVSNTELYGGKVDDKTKEIVDGIISSYDSMPSKTRKAMKNAMNPMLEEMEKTEPSLYAKAAGIATGILGRLKGAFDIHSPSRKTREIFKNVMLGAEKGIDDEQSNLRNKTNKVAQTVLDNLEEINSDSAMNISRSNQFVERSSNNSKDYSIDYYQLYLMFLKALNSCKIKIDGDGFIRLIDDRLREVL